MGKWQAEYEAQWKAYAAGVLRAQFGRRYDRYEVTQSDRRELRELLRSMGSDYDPFAIAATPTVKDAVRRRRSSVRQTPQWRSIEAHDDESPAMPATQVLAYEMESEGNTSDTSMHSDMSYVYETPQPKARSAEQQQRRRRQRSPAAAVSSVERMHKRKASMARSSTSTFPAFTPRDLNGSRDQPRLSESLSQTLRRRMLSVSPIGRLRFSVGSALNDSVNESRTTFAENDESAVLFTVDGRTPGEENARTPRPMLERTTQLGATEGTGDEREGVVDLNVSMQSMHLGEDDAADDDDVAMDDDPEETGGRRIAAALDFNDASDDDDEELVQETDKADDVEAEEERPVSHGRWHWSEATIAGETESGGDAPISSETGAKAARESTAQVEEPTNEQEVIEIDDDFRMEPDTHEMDHQEESESQDVIILESDPTEQQQERACDQDEDTDELNAMLKQRLQKAGLALSDEETRKLVDEATEEQVNPFESSTASADAKGSPTASSSSGSASTTSETAKRIYYRTKLPLPVESTSTNVDDRRRERRQKLKKRLAKNQAVHHRTPECHVELAPYQREAVEWMLARENVRAPKNAKKVTDKPTTARQRELYYDRLSSKMHGGILADEMGLGKTVCCIALICESLQHLREDASSGGSMSEANDGIPRLKPPTLIITPLSILGQWEKEIREKTNLSVISYQGHTRRQIENVMDFMGVDVVLSTYDTLRLKECKVSKGIRGSKSSDDDDGDDSEDADMQFDKLNDSRQWRTAVRRLSNSKKAIAGSKLHQLTWYRVILDESHLITNPSCARARAALFLKSKRRWCVTGTPIQNSGKDLSALMTFLGMTHVPPDLDFHQVLSRVMLRRLKSTVDSESNEPIVQLPEKREEVMALEFASDVERAFYMLLHRSTKKRVFEYLRSQRHGGGGQFMHVFELLLRLRQCCNSCVLVSDDPMQEVQNGNGALLAEIGTLSRQEAMLVEGACASTGRGRMAAKYSTKIAVLLRELKKMQRLRERGLVVSQWTSFLDLIADAIQDDNLRNAGETSQGTGIKFCRLDGRMSAKEREQAVASFQVEKRVDVLLVSLRTGGLGLNLTAASQVFIMEPSWNPSIESQAIDRAHRVGQTLPVRVVRFLMKDSIEERVVELQRKKKDLAVATLGDGVALSQAPPPKETALTRDELRDLFSQDVEDAFLGPGEDDATLEGEIWDDME